MPKTKTQKPDYRFTDPEQVTIDVTELQDLIEHGVSWETLVNFKVRYYDNALYPLVYLETREGYSQVCIEYQARCQSCDGPGPVLYLYGGNDRHEFVVGFVAENGGDFDLTEHHYHCGITDPDILKRTIVVAEMLRQEYTVITDVGDTVDPRDTVVLRLDESEHDRLAALFYAGMIEGEDEGKAQDIRRRLLSRDAKAPGDTLVTYGGMIFHVRRIVNTEVGEAAVAFGYQAETMIGRARLVVAAPSLNHLPDAIGALIKSIEGQVEAMIQGHLNAPNGLNSIDFPDRDDERKRYIH